jgi:signal transduction histidine kinase
LSIEHQVAPSAPRGPAAANDVADRSALRERAYRAIFRASDAGHLIGQLVRARPADGRPGRAMDYRFLEVNDAYLRMTGLERDLVLRLSARQLVPGLDPRWVERVAAIVESGRPARIEQDLPTLGASFDSLIVPLDDDRFAATFTDSTERRRAERLFLESGERQSFMLGQQASDARYRSLFDAIDDGLAILEMTEDPPGDVPTFRVTETNHAFERLREPFDPSDPTARAAFPLEGSGWLLDLRRVIQTGEPRRLEDVAARGDRWFDLSATRIGGPHSRSVAVVASDVTERKRREASLGFLDAVQDELVRLATVDAILATVGRMVGDFLGVDWSMFLEVDDPNDEAAIRSIWPASGAPSTPSVAISSFGDDIPRRMREGQTVVIRDARADSRIDERIAAALDLRASIGVPFHRGGIWAAVFVVGQRVPRDWRPDEVDLVRELAHRLFPRLERAQAEASLRDSEARLRHNETELRSALAVKDEFLGLVSHELRTPMTVILGMSEILDRDDLPLERVRNVASDIAESAEVLHGLIESMLLLARLDRDEALQHREPVLLHRAASAVVERQRRKDHERRYALDVVDDAALVDVKPEWLERVLDNLLGNAAKYSAPGGPIEVRIDVTEAEVECRVLDTGPLLTDEDLEPVFDPFYRSLMAQQRAPGTGLGLAVAKRIVELMDGRIWARPRPTGGAEFGFALPRIADPGI